MQEPELIEMRFNPQLQRTCLLATKADIAETPPSIAAA
jgi:hypothetical protein